MDHSIIGGADGPTSIFLAGKMGDAGIPWINFFGLVIVVLMLLPNIIYAMRYKDASNKCSNVVNLPEQVGRYASIFLMIFNIGIAEFGFSSLTGLAVYTVGNICLLILYWLIWMLYFIKPGLYNSLLLAVIAPAIFLLSGIALRHVLLIVSALIFGVSHIIVTYQNAVLLQKYN